MGKTMIPGEKRGESLYLSNACGGARIISLSKLPLLKPGVSALLYCVPGKGYAMEVNSYVQLRCPIACKYCSNRFKKTDYTGPSFLSDKYEAMVPQVINAVNPDMVYTLTKCEAGCCPEALQRVITEERITNENREKPITWLPVTRFPDHVWPALVGLKNFVMQVTITDAKDLEPNTPSFFKTREDIKRAHQAGVRVAVRILTTYGEGRKVLRDRYDKLLPYIEEGYSMFAFLREGNSRYVKKGKFRKMISKYRSIDEFCTPSGSSGLTFRYDIVRDGCEYFKDTGISFDRVDHHYRKRLKEELNISNRMIEMSGYNCYICSELKCVKGVSGDNNTICPGQKKGEVCRGLLRMGKRQFSKTVKWWKIIQESRDDSKGRKGHYAAKHKSNVARIINTLNKVRKIQRY